MRKISILKIGLISLSFLSVSVFSLKIIEVHLHFGSSANAQSASPLFKVEPNASFPYHWDVSIPNDGQWHNTGLIVPSNKEYVTFSPVTVGDSIENIDLRVGGEEISIRPTTSPEVPTSGFHARIAEKNQNTVVALKNKRGQPNSVFQLRIWFANSVWTDTRTQK